MILNRSLKPGFNTNNLVVIFSYLMIFGRENLNNNTEKIVKNTVTVAFRQRMLRVKILGFSHIKGVFYVIY